MDYDTSSLSSTYDPAEQELALLVFSSMLRHATVDGGRKRAAGEKPAWWQDPDHEPAIFSHLSKWKHDELVDEASGAHPLVHLAWRALAIAYQETHGQIDPEYLPTDEKWNVLGDEAWQ